MLESRLTEAVVSLGRKIHHTLGPGFDRDAYLNALAIEFTESRFRHERNRTLDVLYRRRIVGAYRADFVIQDRVLVLVRNSSALTPADDVHLINRVAATGTESGVLLNFGTPELEVRVHRIGEKARETENAPPALQDRTQTPARVP
ncbi:MAG TPA: GxxExxY protein [Verrucomicrobiales bacterium]|nr:GxxExxY protein [Verrucomicrobiales bacterium]